MATFSFQDATDYEFMDGTTFDFMDEPVPDPYWDDVIFLLANGEGTNGVAPTADVSRHAHTLAQSGTSVSYDSATAPSGSITGMPLKMVDSFIDVDGASTGLGANVVPVGNKWEFECRFYNDDASWNATHLGGSRNGQDGSEWVVYHNSGTMRLFVDGADRLSWTAPSVKAWHHLVVGYDGTQFYAFVDGVSQGTATVQFYWFEQHFGLGSYYLDPTNGTYAWNGWFEMIRYTNVNRYTAGVGFTAPTTVLSEGTYTAPTTDPDWANVTLLLANGEGSDGGTTFTDQSSASTTITVNGTPEYDTGIAGITGVTIDNSGSTSDNFSITHTLSGAETFTAECMFRANNLTGVQYIFNMRSASGGTEWTLYLNASTLTMWCNGSIRWTATASATTWYHARVVYDSSVATGGAYYFFLNGLLRASWTTAVTSHDPELWFGSYYGDQTLYHFDGSLELIRLTEGSLRTTGNGSFPTPTAAYLTGTEPPTAGDIIWYGPQLLDRQFGTTAAARFNGVMHT